MASPARWGAMASACCRYRATSTNAEARAAPPKTARATPVLSDPGPEELEGHQRVGGAALERPRRPPGAGRSRRGWPGRTGRSIRSRATPRAAWTRAMTAPVMVAAPRQSNRRRGPRAPSSSTCRARRTAATETGTVTRKTEDQPKVPASRPPSEDAGGSAEPGGGAPDAHGPGPCRTGEGQQEQRHRGGAERGGAGALDDAAGHEHRRVGGGGGEQGASGEQGRPGDEHAASAEQVCGASGQQQQAAEREDVGVDHPGDAGRAEPEVGLDGGQRHVDDRGVEHDDELGGDQQPQGDRAAAATEEAGQRSARVRGRRGGSWAPARCGRDLCGGHRGLPGRGRGRGRGCGGRV